MKILKRIGLILGILLVVLIASAFAIPYFFKDDIVKAAKDQINQTVNATVDFEDVSISLFRSFPDISFQLKNYSVVGKDEFEGITLAKGESVGLDLDLMSVIRNEHIEINAVDLVKPNIHVIVLRDGKANYDITHPAPAAAADTTTSADFQIQLESYSVEDGHIIYDDRTMPVYVELTGLNHKGSGNFTSDIYDLVTTTDIAQFTAEYDGTTYLVKATTDLEATFNIDTKSSKYTLQENELKVNDMIVKADGYVQMAGDDINMDLTFSAPQNEFKNFFSLIPYAYIKDYDDVKINGGFTFDGYANGTFNSEKEQYPSFKINLGVTNGDVKYPDLPVGISDINASVLVHSPSENLNDMSVDVSRFNVQIGNNPFGGTFKLRTPMTDPDIDTKVKGIIDLGDLAKAFPIEGVETLNGIINADVAAKTRMSTIDKEDYANVKMSGKATITDMTYDAVDMPAVKINTLQTSFNPQNVTVDKFEGKLGESDMYATGKIDNILAFFSPKSTMKGQFTVRSNYFNADEWMESSEPTEEIVEATATPPPSDDAAPFENFNFDINASFGKLIYDIYNLTNMSADANISSNKLTINDFRTKINGSDIAAKGVVDNVLNFVYYNEGIKGDIEFSSNYMDLIKLMEGENPPPASASTSSETATTAEIPDMKFDLNMKGTVQEMDYDVYKLTNFSGDTKITEKQVVINSFNTKIGKSDMSGSGTINDYMEYVYKNETVSGDLIINSQYMDLNELMAEDPAAAAAAAANPAAEVEPFLVPENMDFNIVAKVDKALYTNMELRNIDCTMKVADEMAAIENMTTNTLGGKIAMQGAYNTKDKENPKFDFKYDIANVDFKQSFNTLNTFQAAAPIGKYIDGKFNTTLVMDGFLGKDMMPRLNSLSADGFLETIKGVIEGAPALNAVSDKLGVSYFSQMEFLNTKNWFTIKDGKVEVKEFDYTYKDIDMKIGGWHGLTQDMDYKIKAKIPRALLKGSVGDAANKGLDFLSGQASKLGVNLAQGEFVNVLINLTGSLTKPDVGIKLLGTEGERTAQEEATAAVTEKVDEVKEEAKQKAEEKIADAKEQAKKEADKVVDTLSTAAKQKADEIVDKGKEKVEQVVKDEIGKQVGEEAADKAKEKVGEVLGEDAKEEVDKIKDKLDGWNPFGKKKDKDKDKKDNKGN